MKLMLISVLITSIVCSQRLNVPTLSPNTKITQQVALTEVKLDYSRPSAKGRTVMGELVPFGKIWRTGANASTKLTFSEDVMIEGNPLKAGTYAMYTIPGPTEWTMIIHSNTKMRSLAGNVYNAKDDMFRFKSKIKRIAHEIETFTIEFTDITSKSLNVTLTWEHTLVSFKIDFAVDKNVDQQIKNLTASNQMTDRNLFLAAEYNYHNDRDLNQAIEWITHALKKKKNDPRYGLLHAKILAKQDKTDDAIAVIKAANKWATDKNNANYIGQTQRFWDSIK